MTSTDRIAIVNDYFARSGPGGHYRIQGISKALKRMGNEVILISPWGTYHDGAKLPEKRPTETLTRQVWNNSGILLKRLRDVKASRFVFEIPFPAVKALVAATKRVACDLVHLDIGDYWLESRFAPVQRLLDRLITGIARQMTGVSVATHALAEFFMRRGFSPDSLCYLPCSVDLELFDLPRVRKESAQSYRDFTIAYSGRVTRDQGCEAIIPILARVVAHDAHARMLILGDGEYLPELQRDATERGLRKHLHVAGSVPHARVPSYLARSKIGLCLEPPMTEGALGTFPQKVAEYMAMGCAPIVTPIAEAPYLFTHGSDGLILPQDEIANHMVSLLEDPGRLREMQRRTVSTAKQNFDLQENVRRLWEFWDSVSTATPWT